MKVLIIEDEPYAQEELKRLLALCDPSIQVWECIDSVEDSIIWLEEPNEPDLIFMDIQLSDGLSFDIFKHTEVKAPVIFTTAYDEYAIRAFKVNSIDYLLKPVEEEALKSALRKYAAIRRQYTPPAQAQNYFNPAQIEQLLQLNKRDYKSRFVTTIGDRIKQIGVEQVAYFFADDNTVYLVTADKKKYIINYTLDQLEELLDPRHFFRINRKYITKITAIGDINKYFNSRLKVSLVPPVEDEILISRVKVPDFLDWMDK
ncbi:response regulator transcription factor [Rhodocytophaga rosea]|uniref:Response regulator transcription factor n=1 Tax=Rhodocytophaga rosea TaxID=2704465 RepID=A0A6C0GSK5_9BACT|nr:LytTR family DNA-binding domain-containing protein [Rhodocytophaga rosea]QHT70593.1 response regulator transcription factor [Rhodocytophaga rosea]